jgi:hypothetical protein
MPASYKRISDPSSLTSSFAPASLSPSPDVDVDADVVCLVSSSSSSYRSLARSLVSAPRAHPSFAPISSANHRARFDATNASTCGASISFASITAARNPPPPSFAAAPLVPLNDPPLDDIDPCRVPVAGACIDPPRRIARHVDPDVVIDPVAPPARASSSSRARASHNCRVDNHRRTAASLASARPSRPIARVSTPDRSKRSIHDRSARATRVSRVRAREIDRRRRCDLRFPSSRKTRNFHPGAASDASV